jgi:hypothetical protein
MNRGVQRCAPRSVCIDASQSGSFRPRVSCETFRPVVSVTDLVSHTSVLHDFPPAALLLTRANAMPPPTLYPLRQGLHRRPTLREPAHRTARVPRRLWLDHHPRIHRPGCERREGASVRPRRTGATQRAVASTCWSAGDSADWDATCASWRCARGPPSSTKNDRAFKANSPISLSTGFPQQFTDPSTELTHILRAVSPMNSERRDFELWRAGDWRCEWWSVGGQPQVRLYLGEHQVADLTSGPHLDLWRQTAEWRAAALADRQQH